MFVWWHHIWNKDSRHLNTNRLQQQQEEEEQQQRRKHHTLDNHATINQLSYSVHHNCRGQSKCIRKTTTEHHTSQINRMNSFCSVIILIHCFNVFVLAIASENLSTAQQQQQPCDRSRRVFTEMRGELSNGPPGYNYTQVSNKFWFSLSLDFLLVPSVRYCQSLFAPLAIW